MDIPDVIAPVELTGSRAEKLKTLEASIARLQALRAVLLGEAGAPEPSSTLHGPYINAPVWPWFVAGWLVGALFVLFFVFAWATS